MNGHGSRSKLVEEVFEFCATGPVVGTGTPEIPMPDGVVLVDDLREALRLAWDEFYGDYTWTDIRELEASRLVAAGNALTPSEWEAVWMPGLEEKWVRGLKKRLPKELHETLDDVMADLSNVARARAFFGATDAFFERLFALYRAGGWPCGWRDGPPPAGTPIVFVPSASTKRP